MPKFIIGSVYLLKNKPKMVYLGDQAGILQFKGLSTGEVYQAPFPEVEFEVPKVTASTNNNPTPTATSTTTTTKATTTTTTTTANTTTTKK